MNKGSPCIKGLIITMIFEDYVVQGHSQPPFQTQKLSSKTSPKIIQDEANYMCLLSRSPDGPRLGVCSDRVRPAAPEQRPSQSLGRLGGREIGMSKQPHARPIGEKPMRPGIQIWRWYIVSPTPLLEITTPELHIAPSTVYPPIIRRVMLTIIFG